MVWYAWAVVIVMVVSCAATILAIGQPRKPLTPALALATVLTNLLMVWAIVELAS